MTPPNREPVQNIQTEIAQPHFHAFVLAADSDIKHVRKIIGKMKSKGLSVCIKRILFDSDLMLCIKN